MITQISTLKKTIFYSLLGLVLLYFLFYFLRNYFAFLPNNDIFYNAFLVLAIFIFLILYNKRNTTFYIDTEGEAITIQYKNFISSSGSSFDFRMRKEFPNYKLINFYLKKGIFNNSIVFEIRSKRSQNKSQKIAANIMLLSSDATNKILKNLDLIKKKNQDESKLHLKS